MRFAGAIFDQDGLLFDTEILFERAWKQAGAEIGLNVPDALTNGCCGCGVNALPDVIRRFFPDIDISSYVKRALTLAFEAQMATTPTLKPGVREILARCRQMGLRTAIASSSVRRLVDHNVRSAGLAGAFDAIVTGKDVERGKPAPDIFLLAASKLGLEPSACLVFEDALTGIRAAHAAGCHPVMVPDRVQPTPEILSICDCRSSLLEAMDLLEGGSSIWVYENWLE